MRDFIIRKAMDKYKDIKNINKALELYLENDATEEEKIPLLITRPNLYKLKKVLKTARPICEECGAGLMMKEKAYDYKGKLHETAWICPCGIIEYSDKTADEWLEILSEDRG
jgi:tRNA(Ile2) C34 agmatinyltransferase TiaS